MTRYSTLLVRSVSEIDISLLVGRRLMGRRGATEDLSAFVRIVGVVESVM
jgi:hypothetical protein